MKLRDLIPWGRNKTPEPTAKRWVMTDEGMLNTNWDAGWWQQGLSAPTMGLNETVEACVATLAQTVAMCPIYHLAEQDNGERVRRRGSKAERVMYQPTPMYTRTLFLNNALRSVYLTGNAYAVAQRDGNGAIDQLHLMDPRATTAHVDPESGEVFYYATAQHNAPGLVVDREQDRVFHSRDVMHIRINTGRDALVGESPIQAAAAAIAANSSITGHQAAHFSNMARPSGVLQTDMQLQKEQIAQLRDAWEKQAKGMNSGGVPILTSGLKWQQLSISSQDAQTIEAYGMTASGIARAFRVPLPMINDLSNSTFNNAEQLLSWFLSSGLGFLLEHIELELGRLFSLPYGERLNFETRVLLRSDWKTRMEALGAGVLHGIYSPDEARAQEGLPPAPSGGNEPRVQQQVVPLSAYEQELEARQALAQQPPPPAPEDEAAQVEASYQAIRKSMEVRRAG